MKNFKLKDIIVEVLVTALITFVSQVVIFTVTSDDGKIEISQAAGLDNKYIITIGIKNFEKNKYLNDIKIEVLDNINIEDVYISSNDISYKENVFEIEKIIPEQTEIISFKTNDKIECKDIKIINNNNKISIENLNEQTNVQGIVIISLILNVIIFSIISIIIEYFNKKSINRKVDKIREENEEKIEKIKKENEENNIYMEKIEKKILEKEEQLKKIEEESQKELKEQKKENYELQLYCFAKIKDLTKELDFHKELLKNHIEDFDEKKFEQINCMVKEQLKTYNTDKKIEESYETIRFLADRLNNIDKEIKKED